MPLPESRRKELLSTVCHEHASVVCNDQHPEGFGAKIWKLMNELYDEGKFTLPSEEQGPYKVSKYWRYRKFAKEVRILLNGHLMPDFQRESLEKGCWGPRRGKTFEEFYGLEEAEKIRRYMRACKDWMRGKTWSEIYGPRRAKKLLQKISGENCHAWRGGISFEPYGIKFNDKLREQIRKRDSYTCQICGVTQEDKGRALAIHHIDYDKKNNDPSNLISLCLNCHSKTNHSREDWPKQLSIL